jgi:hypothetical protein
MLNQVFLGKIKDNPYLGLLYVLGAELETMKLSYSENYIYIWDPR